MVAVPVIQRAAPDEIDAVAGAGCTLTVVVAVVNEQEFWELLAASLIVVLPAVVDFK